MVVCKINASLKCSNIKTFEPYLTNKYFLIGFEHDFGGSSGGFKQQKVDAEQAQQ